MPHPLKNRWNVAKSRNQLCDRWLDFETFVEDNPHPRRFLCRHNAMEPHSPRNSFWSDRQQSRGFNTGTRARSHWHGDRMGALVILGPMLPPNDYCRTDSRPTRYWVALCDCGNAVGIKATNIRISRYCYSPDCPYRHTALPHHTPGTYDDVAHLYEQYLAGERPQRGSAATSAALPRDGSAPQADPAEAATTPATGPQVPSFL